MITCCLGYVYYNILIGLSIQTYKYQNRYNIDSMDNQKKDEILTAIGYGKCVSHKLPSYMQLEISHKKTQMQNKKESEYKKSVAEQTLFG